MPVPGAILQGAGSGLDRPIDLSNNIRASQIAEESRNAQARLRLAKQSQLNEESKAFSAATDPTKLTGDLADAPVGQAMADINSEFQRRLLAGENPQALKVEMLPRMQQIAKYQTASKIIDANIEKTISAMPKTGAYDLDKIRMEAKKAAFANMQNKDGQYDVSLIDKIDPTKNYVEDLARNHPELITSMENWTKMTKEIPKYKTADEYTEITGPGTSVKHKITGQMNAFEDFVRDKNGRPIGIATQGDPYYKKDKDGNIVKDSKGNPVVETDPDTGKPVMMLKEGMFNDLMTHRDLSDSLRGETKKHFIAAGHPDIAENDPAFTNYMRHLAYQQLEQNKTSDFSAMHDEKQSAMAAKEDEMNDPKYWQNEYKKASISKQAQLDAENRDKQLHPENYKDKTPRSATAETISNIFTDPKSIIGGAPPTSTPDGQQAYDITGGFPKIGPGYVKEFYDAKNHQILLYPKGKTKPEVITADNAGPFMTKIAMLNKENPSAVKKVLTDTGYGDGNYKSGKSDELAAPILEGETKAKEASDKAVSTTIDNGDKASLVNKRTPDGSLITKVDRPWVGSRWTLTLKDPKTKQETTKDFKDSDALKKYMTGSTPEDLINKYKP